jgi:NAD(P)-dependent dehydrogenase (short-subunit alcohol dehydrogenase family)
VIGVTGRLAGKVALVTGAGSGIGRATALRLAADGAAVVVNDRDGDAATTTVGEVVASGGRADAVVGDVADGAVLDEAVAAAVQRHGRLDVVHNNAGYGVPSRVADMTDEELQLMLAVNLFGVLHGTRSALPVMIEQGSGSIVNTASAAALGASRDRASYAVAKAAVVNLTRVTAVENGRHGVRANAVLPGPVQTPAFERFAPDLDFYASQMPMRRLGRPEDVAALVAFLASDDAAYISGAAIPVDGAMGAAIPAPFLTLDDVGDRD